MQTLHTSPGLEDIWQLHWAYNAGIEYNPSGLFIANIDDPETLAQVITAPPASDAEWVPAARRQPVRLQRALPASAAHLAAVAPAAAAAVTRVRRI